jgi:H+-transporting ATPase
MSPNRPPEHVLTEPGLAGIVAAVQEGRLTFQRILTYTLNSITKKIVQVVLLAAGLVGRD